MFTKEQSERYARQLALDDIGEAGQSRLLAGRVLLVGVGGLGSPAALYLVAAGIGRLTLVDADRIDLSNLQRQVLYTSDDIGTPKVRAAQRRLTALNPDTRVTVHDERLTAENANGLVSGHDFVIDATDNFDAKFLIADACHATGVPYSHAGIDKFFGQTLTVLPGRTTCYRCLFSEPPPASDAAPTGPIGAVPGVIGTVQANEAIKCITAVGTPLTNRLFTYDALDTSVRIIPVQPNPECVLCGSAAAPPTSGSNYKKGEQ
jgi:molybdopterin/thiamine biosynthesis adenylyltransferase